MSSSYAGEYKLRECKIVSSRGVVADLDSKVISFQIYENMFSQSLVASMTIIDNTNMVMKLPIIGQEYIILKIENPGVGEIDFTKNVFSVTNVKVRQDVSNDTQLYDISLVSTESLRNSRTRVSKSYNGSVSDIVTSVLRDESLIDTNKDIYVDNTSGSRRFVAPNIRPFRFIRNLTREATSELFEGSPHYFFYENCKGFQFRCLDGLYKRTPNGSFVADSESINNNHSKSPASDIEKDYRRVLKFSISRTNDTLLATMGGMLGSNLIKYNIFHKNYQTYNFNYFDNFRRFGRIDKNPIYNNTSIDVRRNNLGSFPNSKIHLHPTSNDGLNDTQFYDTDIGYHHKDNSIEQWLQTSRSKALELNGGMNVQLKVHGYSEIAVGDTINLELPITGTDHDNEQIDTIYKGDFLVTQLKHDFDQSERQHRILMSVVKDSIPEEFKNIQSSEEPRGERGYTYLPTY
tara:strand:+ start:1226 stop:2608 length:1383 start_codon:yes stop_codon:yes gene_type:complete